jgi:hypothetical protein
MSFNTDYKVNNVNYSNLDLSQIFPPYEIQSINISNSDQDNSGIITLANNKTSTTTYHVFATYFYLAPNGSGGTYAWPSASGSANQILIFSKTSSTFSWGFTKTTGNNWNGGVSFLVIYSP